METEKTCYVFTNGVDSVFDIVWNENTFGKTTYADVHKRREYEFHNFEIVNTELCLLTFRRCF